MKMKVASKSALNEMALKSGAMVTDSSGKKFNSSKKTAIKRPPEPEPPKRLEAAEPKPQPPPPPKPLQIEGLNEGAEIVARSVDDASKATVMMMAELKRQIADIQFHAPQPILDWVLTFDRDSKTGYTNSVRIKAVMEKPTLN